MMRRLALALLFLNVLYVLWTALRPVPVPAKIAGDPGYGESLVLVEELQRPLLLVERMPAYCPALGPFASESDLLEFAGAHLVGRGWRMDVEELSLSPMYRVYVSPPEAPLEGAVLLASVREAIAAASLDIDSYLVVGGDLDGVVSLGLFAGQGNARRVYERITGLGITAEMQTESRMRTLYWIVVAGDKDSDFIQKSVVALQALGAGTGNTEKLCEMIALPD